jgi:hypothetical protein
MNQTVALTCGDDGEQQSPVQVHHDDDAAAGKLNQTVALTCNDDGEQQSDFQTSKAKGKLCQTISPVKAMETRKFYGKARKLQKRAHCKPSRYAD